MFSQAHKTKDSPYFRQKGSSPLNIYYSTRLNNGTISTAVQAVNLLRASPFHSGEGGKFDRISFEVTTAGAAGAVGRVGVYKDLYNDDSNLYPGILLVDGGEFSLSSTGVKSTTIDIELEPDRIYWFAVAQGGFVATMRVTGNTPTSGILGFPNTVGSSPRTGIGGSQTYGALPSSFPSGFSPTTTGHVEIVLRRYA